MIIESVCSTNKKNSNKKELNFKLGFLGLMVSLYHEQKDTSNSIDSDQLNLKRDVSTGIVYRQRYQISTHV